MLLLLPLPLPRAAIVKIPFDMAIQYCPIQLVDPIQLVEHFNPRICISLASH